MFMRFVAVLACTAAVASAQTLSTTFANNNGGSVGGAVYFDLTSTNAAGLTITGLDLNLSAGTGSVDIYSIPGGTFIGNQASAAPWGSPIVTGTVTSAGPGASTVTLSGPIVIPGTSTGAYAIVANGLSHAYTNGTTTPQLYSDANLTLSAGSASNAPFTAPTFTPRIVNTNVTYVVGSAGTLATNTDLGQGCYAEFTSFYELFADAASAAPEMTGQSMVLTPTASGYVAAWGGASYDLPGPPTVLPLTDDGEVTYTLAGGPFPTPAGGVTDFRVHGNAVISMGASAQTFPGTNNYTPTAGGCLNAANTAFWSWHDYNVSEGGAITAEEKIVGADTILYLTWDNVESYSVPVSLNPSTLQFQFNLTTGQVAIVWVSIDADSTSTFGSGHLIGYSPGGPSNDPGSIDLSSALPISVSGADVLPLALTATSRPVTGTDWDLVVSNGDLLDLIIVGTTDPNIPDLFFLGAPGCGLRSSLDLVEVGSMLSVPIPANPTLVGLSLFANGASLSPAANAFGVITSNGIEGMIGDL